MKISKYLESLGNTPDEVAESLRKQGVKGIKETSDACPIINGIYKNCPNAFPGLRIIAQLVKSGDLTNDKFHYKATFDDIQIIDPELPQAVIGFLQRFDFGEYDFLDVLATTQEEK